MHAPVTAFLVETILTGAAPGGIASLPEPFADRQLDLRAFAPGRDFHTSSHESAVL
jgi:hypothetical protein